MYVTCNLGPISNVDRKRSDLVLCDKIIKLQSIKYKYPKISSKIVHYFINIHTGLTFTL